MDALFSLIKVLEIKMKSSLSYTIGAKIMGKGLGYCLSPQSVSFLLLCIKIPHFFHDLKTVPCSFHKIRINFTFTALLLMNTELFSSADFFSFSESVLKIGWFCFPSNFLLNSFLLSLNISLFLSHTQQCQEIITDGA